MLDIQLLYVADCPHSGLARERLAAALARSGVAATVREHVADSETDARDVGMLGSPTILIDGVDPFVSGSSVPSMSCRLYPVGGGLEGSPSVDQLLAVLAD